MTSLAEIQVIADEALSSVRSLSDRLEQRLGRPASLMETAQGLAFAYGAARGALSVEGAGEDLRALAKFAEIASDDARFCLLGLREAGL